ncbi:GM12978 [Drosophila sechellia]|uniref:GM12978 n=1 Tax=Drosophila sechellia TaxID=7238 RepID=B4IL20_DROSE|nr:GM12978 [Drosophila sechellia]
MSDTIATEKEGICPLSESKGQEIDTPVDQDSQKLEQDILETYITAPLKIVEPFEKFEKERRRKTKRRIARSSTSPEDLTEIEVISAKAKKSVSFNPNDEEIRKFTTGEPIVDQKNPFRNGNIANTREKKTPPPVPTKRSTLSVRKTVTQQLREREREREREKEREQQKNESNTRKSKINRSQPPTDDFVTTEEVLKQSKYVKTYIKNPDAYFVYDPTVLARLRLEELKETTGKLPKRKQTVKETRTGKQARHQNQNPNQNQKAQQLTKPPQLTFKKCSKPNYPELANLKIRTGTNSDPESSALFNPAEVTKNARKFDERVKKLQITSDDDLDDIDGPLTKSESSVELAASSSVPQSPDKPVAMSAPGDLPSPSPGTFTNTISSDEFQAYLDSKGLALMPRRELFSPTPTIARTSTPMQTAEERRQQIRDGDNTTLQRRNGDNSLRRSTLERPGVNPRRQWPEAQQVGRINRSTSVDRSQFTHEQPALASPVASSTPVRGQNQWDQLRAIKEVTDRQLYHKLHQQQQLQAQPLQGQQQQHQQQQQQHTIRQRPNEDIYSQVIVHPDQTNFVRGSMQRNTFSGISGRSRPLMVYNGTPMRQQQMQQQPPRCQSVLDNMTPSAGNPGQQTPVVMRHRVANQGQTQQIPSRRIGGLLTREEILEKVKEFCRKSITRAPEAKTPLQPIYKRHLTPPNADVSPVSYASVDDQCARPQVPQRVQSLPVAQGRYVTSGMSVDGQSPIYAHVSKRNSLLSNVSEQYLSNQQLGTLTRPVPLNQLVLVDTGEGVQVAQLVDYLPYVRPAPTQGYMMQDGRATPLILDQSAQQTSQIYWTPQYRQRISHPVPAPRFMKGQAMPTSRNSTISRHMEERDG